MRNITIAVLGAIVLFGVCGTVARSQQGGGRPAAAPVPDAAKDKTMFWGHDDILARWKDNEARKVLNSRLMNGTLDQTINVRIVGDDDAPAVHGKTADVWIVQAGTATAVTDGQLVGAEAGQNGDSRGKSIANATERPVQAGDILYVPPGIPHYFKDVKGFRAFLIRFNPQM